MNRDFKKIINKAKSIKSLIDYDNPLVKAILNDDNDDSDNKVKTINSLKHSYFNKEDYEFHLYVFRRSMPVRNPNSEFKLDFAMKRFYFLEIAINDNKEYCKVVLDKFDKKIDSENAFISWVDFITNNKSNVILKKIVEIKNL